MLATHQTEDVAALCERVVVLDAGRVLYDGSVTRPRGHRRGPGVAGRARDEPARSRRGAPAPGGTATSGHRPPADAELVEPTLEDAYLLLRGVGRPDLDEVRS